MNSYIAVDGRVADFGVFGTSVVATVVHDVNTGTVSSCVPALIHIVPVGRIVVVGCFRYSRCVRSSGSKMEGTDIPLAGCP
jgi:hypothetical protein